MKWVNCTTCGAKHGAVEDSTECRHCRGWHDCSKCEKRLPNSEYYNYLSRGKPKIASECARCAKLRDRTSTKPTDRRTTNTSHTSRRSILTAYKIQRHELPLVERALEATRLYRPVAISRGKRPDHPTPLAILEEAGYGFDLRISQAVLELYRLEIQQEKAA